MHMAILTVIVILVLLTIYEIAGMAFNSITGTRQSAVLNIVCGYMVYFILYEAVYLICLIIRNNLGLMKILWAVVLVLMISASLFIARDNVGKLAMNIRNRLERDWNMICITGATTLVFLVIYVFGVSRVSGDSYAYGAISDAVESGKMFMRDVYTGADMDGLDMPYALSGYYMHTAMLCSFLKISPMVMQHNVMGTICILVSLGLVYLIGRMLFHNSSKHVCGLIILYELFNLYLLMYSDAHYFLLTGAYDEVTQIPYVLIPCIILGYIYILRAEKGALGWSIMALCGAASCALSISSVLIVPIAILCGTIYTALDRRQYRVMINGALCVLPCIVYNVIYWICK